MIQGHIKYIKEGVKDALMMKDPEADHTPLIKHIVWMMENKFITKIQLTNGKHFDAKLTELHQSRDTDSDAQTLWDDLEAMCDEPYGDTTKQKERQAKLDAKPTKRTKKKKRNKGSHDIESKNSTNEDEDARPMKLPPLYAPKCTPTASPALDMTNVA